MKIVQLLIREVIEQKTFMEINSKHKKAWLKPFGLTLYFFRLQNFQLLLLLAFGLVWWLKCCSQGSITLGIIFLFIRLSQMLFRPLRQIADKFNTLQMGMVAANRVFCYSRNRESKSKIMVRSRLPNR